MKMKFKTLPFEINSDRRKEQDVLNAMGSMYVVVTSIGVINGSSVQPSN